LVNISLDDPAAARAWFSETIEPLADSFDAAGVDRYVRLFSEVLAHVDPALRADELIARYERVRRPRAFDGPEPDDVFVLSRVTLGADIAIASVMLDGAKRRFPDARVWFVGSGKSHELFAADPRIGHAPASYNRVGSVRDRIAAGRSLASVLNHPGAIVIDPDSRLTQLGLVPVCDESRYYFFESRGSDEPGTLSEMATRWARRTFGVEGARAYLAPAPVTAECSAGITVSIGVGENPAKRLADPFERQLMGALAARARTVLVDEGAGGEESERVARATTGLANVRLFRGSFAAFAARIAASRLYVGYDSAGQHAAAAAGVPLIAVFAGYPNERFVERWQPTGPGLVTVIRADRSDPLMEVTAAIDQTGFAPTREASQQAEST
jgi:Glycosyltransferase family 9 (heptosyltransferase)